MDKPEWRYFIYRRLSSGNLQPPPLLVICYVLQYHAICAYRLEVVTGSRVAWCNLRKYNFISNRRNGVEKANIVGRRGSLSWKKSLSTDPSLRVLIQDEISQKNMKKSPSIGWDFWTASQLLSETYCSFTCIWQPYYPHASPLRTSWRRLESC